MQVTGRRLLWGHAFQRLSSCTCVDAETITKVSVRCMAANDTCAPGSTLGGSACRGVCMCMWV